MEHSNRKKKFPIEIKFLTMKHWGYLYLLPSLNLDVCYSMPTLIFMWWIFRIDIIIYKRFPDWFMKYVWNTLNLDFDYLKKKKEDDK